MVIVTANCQPKVVSQPCLTVSLVHFLFRKFRFTLYNCVLWRKRLVQVACYPATLLLHAISPSLVVVKASGSICRRRPFGVTLEFCIKSIRHSSINTICHTPCRHQLVTLHQRPVCATECAHISRTGRGQGKGEVKDGHM